MATHRTKLNEIDAYRLRMEPDAPRPDWFDAGIAAGLILTLRTPPRVAIMTSPGVHQAYPGDWIINGPGGLRVVKAQDFEGQYEIISDGQ